jgi:hypothetical protein
MEKKEELPAPSMAAALPLPAKGSTRKRASPADSNRRPPWVAPFSFIFSLSWSPDYLIVKANANIVF